MKKNGFTLLELLISITVCGFLLFSAFSHWIQFKQRNEVQLLIREIKTAIHYAKIHAINHRRPLILSSDNWSKGMSLVQSGTEKLIHQWSWTNGSSDVHWFGVNGLNSIVITGSIGNAMSNGQFVITNKHSGERVVLVLNRLGRVRQA